MSIPRSLEVLLLALLAGAAGLPASAAQEAAEARRRLAEQRAAIEARARAAQAACAGQFAVTACIDRAKAERRAQLQRVEHEAAVLDAEDRRHRAAQRLQRIEQRQAASARPVPEAEPRAHDPKASEAEPRQSQPPLRLPSTAATQRQAAASAADARAAQRAAASARRASEVAAHRAAIEAHNRERDKRRPPAKPLPPPSATD